MTCVAAARAYGIDIIDGVYNDSAMPRASRANARRAATWASTARPSSIRARSRPATRRFRPTPDEVAQARKIIAAFERPENKDKGVIALDGRMVERLHADMARRTVAIADAIAARTA